MNLGGVAGAATFRFSKSVSLFFPTDLRGLDTVLFETLHTRFQPKPFPHPFLSVISNSTYIGIRTCYHVL